MKTSEYKEENNIHLSLKMGGENNHTYLKVFNTNQWFISTRHVFILQNKVITFHLKILIK